MKQQLQRKILNLRALQKIAMNNYMEIVLPYGMGYGIPNRVNKLAKELMGRWNEYDKQILDIRMELNKLNY